MYPTKKLWEICEILDKFRKPVTSSDRKKWIYPYYWATWIQDFVDSYIFDDELVLIWEDWAKWWSWCKTAFKISGKTWVNNHAHVLKTKSGILLDNWLIYFINFSNLEWYITWATVKKLNQEKLKQIPIPLPPLSTQKLIVEKLDMIFSEIEKSKNLLEKNLQNVDEMNKSVLEKIFANDEWERKKLGEVCELIMWQSPKSETYNTEWVGLPFFQWKKEFWEIFPTPEIFCSNPIKIAEKWDILISVRAPVGPTNIANEKCCIWRWLWAIRAKENCILSSYVFKFFKKFEKEISELWKWSTFASITKTDLENLSISLPPLSQQKEIVAYLDSVFAENKKLKTLYETQIKNLDEMKQSFLKKAFTGELV